MIRMTTNGVLKGYRSDLMGSFIKLNKAMETVLTQRNFNTYAEDPAAASESFQLRRSFLRVESQYNISNSTIRKYNMAYSALDAVVESVDTQMENSSWTSVIAAANDPVGSGRAALGQELQQLASGIAQIMNGQYGDTFVFSGADGLNVPFTWEEDANGNKVLYYRGAMVDAAVGDDDLAKLQYMENEKNFVDLGLGLKETGTEGDGDLIESSAFNSALQGINYLGGYGVDDDGDPRNVVSIIQKMGEILSRCDGDGKWAENTTDKEDFQRLMGKLEKAADRVKETHVELTTEAAFLEENHSQLERNADTLNEQIMDIEKCDLADAITAFARYI